MGEENRPLPLPAGVWTDAALKDGKADFPAFTPADPDAAPKPAATKPPSDNDAGAGGGGSPEEIAVRAFIKEFNTVVAEKDFKELPGYFVKRQRGPVREMIKVGDDLLAKFNELIAAIEAKSPGAADSLKAHVKLLEASQSRELNVEGLTVVSPTEVTGKLIPPEGIPVPAESLEARFVLNGEDWEAELKQIDVGSAALPAIQAMIAQFDTLIGGVKSGAMPPETVVQQLSAAIAATQPTSDTPKPSDN